MREQKDDMRDSRTWDVATEGQVARMIRAIINQPPRDEKHPALIELKRITGRDHGTNVTRWLNWYIEQHLGMRNAIRLMQGREFYESQPAPARMLSEDEIFDSAEYNWCAIERVRNKDDMQKLRMLYSDLESPIQVDAEGPFSFRRLTETDESDWELFRGKSISQAVFATDVQLRHLRILKDYGKTMMTLVMPVPTQRAGTVIYAAAICQALVRFDTKITSLSYRDLTESIPGLVERPYIVQSYADLFRKALQKCK